MTAMRVIHTGLEHRPQVQPVFEESFEESRVGDMTIREGGTGDAAGEPGAPATNGVGLRSGGTPRS